jgi:hypothetical protein
MTPRQAKHIGQMPHRFSINCSKYYINNNHVVQISLPWEENTDQTLLHLIAGQIRLNSQQC